MSEVKASDMWNRISSTARVCKDVALKNLFQVFAPECLKDGFKAIDGSKAKGIDNVSKKDYEKNLDSNIENLLIKLHNGSYVPSPKREVLIPKANGKTRPIAIGCIEDKLVEKVTATLLNYIYEPIFKNCSFGFRPGRSCHAAIRNAHMILDSKEKYHHVVEIDLASFFNTVNHRLLMNLLRKKIANKRLLSLIHRQLVAKIENTDGELEIPDIGTPQGGIVSPILANVFLHYAIDEWFETEYKGTGKMVRYADDCVFFFKTQEKANAFLESLRTRLGEFKLLLNEEKTRTINFTNESFEIFDFLGFTFYRGRKRKSRGRLLLIKTSKSKLNKTFKEFTEWIKKIRSSKKTKEILKDVNSKLRGHYEYFGFWCNRYYLGRYYKEVLKNLFKWLNRRSQKRSLDYERFRKRIISNLLQPPEIINLKQIGWNPYAKI